MSQQPMPTPHDELTPTAKATKPWYPRLTTWIKNTLRVILYLPLLLLILIALMLGTPFGTQVAVMLADTFVPNLSVTYQSGRLNKQLELAYGHWHMSGIDVEVEGLAISWQPLCLIQKQLCVNALNANKVIVNIDTDLIGTQANNATAESKDNGNESEINQGIPSNGPDTNETLTLPFGIVLTQTQLKNIQVRVNEMQFNAAHIKGTASWLETGLRVNQLESDGLFVSIPLATDKATPEQNPSELDTEWPLATMPQVAIPMPIFIDDARLADSQLHLGTRQDTFVSISLQGSYVGYLVTVDSLSVSHEYGDVKLDGNISLNNHYPMTIHADADVNKINEIPGLSAQQLALTLNGDFNQLKLDAIGKGQSDFTLLGNINLSDASLPYQLNLTSKQLSWPLDSPEYLAKQLVLDSNGSLKQQHASLQAELKTPFHPWLTLDTQLEHQDHRLQIAKLAINSDMGDAKVSGTFDFGDAIAWNAIVDTDKLNLEPLSLPLEEPLPTTLISGHLKTDGLIDKKTWRIGLQQANLTGSIDQYPLTVKGGIRLDNQWHLDADNLIVDALESRLAVSGSVTEQWALNGQLTVPALSFWLPNATGAIDAKINVSGENEHPEVSINAETIELLFADIAVEKATLKGFYRPMDEHQFALSLKSSNMALNDLSLSSMTLGVKGDLNNQKLGLQTFGDLHLVTSIRSTFDEKKQLLNANISRLNLDSILGPWQLEQPIDIVWDNKKLSGAISPFCWQHQQGNLCLQDAIELSENGSTEMAFNGNIGTLLTPLLPQDTVWQGSASLKSSFKWQQGKKPQAKLNLALEQGTVSLKTTKQLVVAKYNYLNLDAQLDEEQLAIDTQFESERFASVSSKITIGVTPEHHLAGNIDAANINLHSLSDFIPQLENIQGMISSELALSGSLADPDITGAITLKDGQLLAAANPTLLDQINATVALSGQKAEISGNWIMGQGKAAIGGFLDWQNDELNGLIEIDGKQLAIIQPPMAILDVSPSVAVKFGPNRVNISGQIDVPSGSINIVQLPEGGVAESSDVVFKDSIASEELARHPTAITSNLIINVGDKLTIDGMGLKGLLQGTLNLRQEALKPPLLYGDIKVVNGTYKFMGQTLDIKAGEVQFIGPMEVPNLNIEATREIKEDDVIAGVRVTGTPLKPVVSLFSSPTKEQAEILSYIIKGTGFNSNSEDQNSALMMGAALTLGNQLGGGTVNNLSNSATGIIEKFGISNVQLDANDDGKVAISGFIGENLMVKYGVGVFNPGYEMTVRYYLMSQLYLESVSGTVEQTLDIYYSFDID
ncbi:autotransporter assembly complex protein TamB [Shewanella colwelliana]|uniref:autotransporter assembly complex protein TamB n=1 Tax=Shewanella colwelliana TaxID=23 RepID=UPI003D064631